MLKRSLLILLALLSTAFQQLPEAVATVSGDSIPAVVFQQRVRLARWMSSQQLLLVAQDYGVNALTDPNSPFNAQYKAISDHAAFAQQVLDGLITIRLVQHEAALRGVTVTDAETQDHINAFFGYTPGVASEGQTPEQAAQEFQENRDNYFGQAGAMARMAQADVIATFGEQALQIKLYRLLTQDLPTQAEQVKVRHILVDNADKANALLAQVRGGADFGEVAKGNSMDTQSGPNGGDMDWSPRGVFVPEFETPIWVAQPGEILGPIKTQFGYHVVQVIGREVRPLSEADLNRERDAAFRRWLQQARERANVQIVDNWQALIPVEPTLQELGLP
jgi:parvulin-like peptidyl-prolyl isomerase